MPSNTMGSESVQLLGSGCAVRLRSLELTVEMFYQSIGDGVVGGCADELGTCMR